VLLPKDTQGSDHPTDTQSPDQPDVLLLATGSEVQLAIEARVKLQSEGVDAWVISMPCLEWFAEQSSQYQDSVLPPQVSARVSIEAGATQGWYKYLGTDGIAIGIDDFGGSAAPAKLFEKFGLTVDNICLQAKRSIAQSHTKD
jgi:transketolase